MAGSVVARPRIPPDPAPERRAARARAPFCAHWPYSGRVNTEQTIPETRYADSDGLSIAYQVFGHGAQDLVVIPGIVSHLEEIWKDPGYAGALRRLGQAFRVITLDKRGQGLSDSIEGVPTLEQRMDDVRVVMQAADSRRAVVFASSEGGAMAALYAASHPARVEKLVLLGSMARFTGAPDYPFSPPLDKMLAAVAKSWGKPASARGFAPSRADDAAFCEALARFQRMTASPSAIRRLIMVNDQIDVRAILPQIRRPTLVIQRRGDRVVTRHNGRYLADHIPDAVYLELPGVDHLLQGADPDAVVDAICRFAQADKPSAAPERADRWLATVLFTDIVGSTDMAARLGDKAWSQVLQRFHAIGRTQLEVHRGVLVDTAGDGVFASFDGPARAIRCAMAIGRAARSLGIDIRAGLHTGEVESAGDKVSGLAVHIGARVMGQAGAGEVLVSGTTRDLVAGSGIGFDARGSHTLKGVPGEWRLWQAQPEPDPPPA